MSTLTEKAYRDLLDNTLARIDRAFDDADPDVAESNLSQGALTVVFGGKHRLIVSPQPSPRQLWLAFRDRAWHCDWNADTKQWLDDRGEGVEALALIRKLTREATGIDVAL